MSNLDLSEVEVVDSHSHPYRLDDLLAKESQGFDTRMTLMGESFSSSTRLSPALWPSADALTDSTTLVRGLRRWLAEHLACDADREAVTRARDTALRGDPVSYTKGLLDAQQIAAILYDDSYPYPPQPRVLPDEFEAAVGVEVHRVAGVEPWIIQHRNGSFDDLVQGVEQELISAGSDPYCVAYKSLIAYLTGLDVMSPSAKDAESAFERWRRDEWREDRADSKIVRDFILRRVLKIARAQDRPVHIHCGAGDPNINLRHARPADIWPLLLDPQDQVIVLIHAGYPWMPEAAWIASVLPNVYLDVSELVPWGLGMLEWGFEVLIGTAPTGKVVYGSDHCEEPEEFWLAARLARGALTRVLNTFVDRDYLSLAEAQEVGRGVLAENTRKLHGIQV